jgi:hypothetical protein
MAMYNFLTVFKEKRHNKYCLKIQVCPHISGFSYLWFTMAQKPIGKLKK